MRATDADYCLTNKHRPAVERFGRMLMKITAALAAELSDAGLSRAQAANVPTVLLIEWAAVSACITRRTLLAGHPDPVRWRSLTDDAFARAVTLTRPRPTAQHHATFYGAAV